MAASIEERHGARPDIRNDDMATWRQMETLVEHELVRNIGTSNMTIPKLDLILGDAKIRSAANEMDAIASIDRGRRLIKGHVFCWKPDQDWRDLWDEDGVIVR